MARLLYLWLYPLCLVAGLVFSLPIHWIGEKTKPMYDPVSQTEWLMLQIFIWVLVALMYKFSGEKKLLTWRECHAFALFLTGMLLGAWKPF